MSEQKTNVLRRCNAMINSKQLRKEIDDWDKQNSDSKSNTSVVPLVQCAQKCAWCGRYLTTGDFASYNGADPLYIGWICHVECNL